MNVVADAPTTAIDDRFAFDIGVPTEVNVDAIVTCFPVDLVDESAITSVCDVDECSTSLEVSVVGLTGIVEIVVEMVV